MGLAHIFFFYYYIIFFLSRVDIDIIIGSQFNII